MCSASPRHGENEASSRFSGNDTFNSLRDGCTGLSESRGFKERATHLLARVNKDEDALAKFESVALQEIVDLIQVNVYLESSVCICSFMLTGKFMGHGANLRSSERYERFINCMVTLAMYNCFSHENVHGAWECGYIIMKQRFARGPPMRYSPLDGTPGVCCKRRQ